MTVKKKNSIIQYETPYNNLGSPSVFVHDPFYFVFSAKINRKVLNQI